MQKPRPETVPEQKQPAMAAFFLRPLEFPVVIHAQEVVFVEAIGAGLLQNEIQEHVAG